MKQLLIAGGVFNLAFAIFHLLFWRIFNWKTELRKLDLMNSAIMQVLNLCLTFCFLIFAYISFFHLEELLTTSIGKALLAGITIFWLLRAVEQIIFFGIKHWQSIIFLLVFAVGTILYAVPFIGLL